MYNQPIFFKKNRVSRVYIGGKLFDDFLADGSTDGFYPEEWIASAVSALSSLGESEGVSVTEDGGSGFIENPMINHEEYITDSTYKDYLTGIVVTPKR